MWKILGNTIKAWLDDRASSKGAALAFYMIFSLAPLLIILIAIVGMFYGEEAATGEVARQIGYFIGRNEAETLQAIVKSTRNSGSGLLASIVATLTLVIASTTVFNELKQSLDEIWRVKTKKQGFLQFLRTRFYAFCLIVLVGLLLLLSLGLSAGMSAFNAHWGNRFANTLYVVETINFVSTALTMTFLFAAIYKLLPSVRIAWRDVWQGAILTSLLFTMGKQLIGFYLGHSGISSTFGAAGSLIILLLWIYYSAQIFFLGAEFTWVYAHRNDACKPPQQPQQLSENFT